MDARDARSMTNRQGTVMSANEAQAIAELRAELKAMKAELARRDIEQVEIEGAVEYLQSQSRTHHWVLGALITSLLGRTDNKHGGKDLHDALYPCDGPTGAKSAGHSMIWQRPDRRWSQFGSMSELVSLAEANGIQLRQRERRYREYLVRRLWAAWLLPGSVDLLTEKIAREESAKTACQS